jgi:hypothetical protein
MKGILFLALLVSGITARSAAIVDTTPYVRVIKNNDRLVSGRIVATTADSLYIRPGTPKEERKGKFYEEMAIPYSDIRSVKIKHTAWIGLLAGAAGIALFYLVFFQWGADLAEFINNDGLALVILAPALFGYSLLQMFKKRQFYIGGEQSRYERFRNKLRKHRD